MSANFKDGLIRDGIGIGTGKTLGNVKDNIIRNGNGMPGTGSAVGNVKDGVIRSGLGSVGNGTPILNVQNRIVRTGSGSGNIIGKVKDFSIKGMERELDSVMVASYHFLVKKII